MTVVIPWSKYYTIFIICRVFTDYEVVRKTVTVAGMRESETYVDVTTLGRGHV